MFAWLLGCFCLSSLLALLKTPFSESGRIKNLNYFFTITAMKSKMERGINSGKWFLLLNTVVSTTQKCVVFIPLGKAFDKDFHKAADFLFGEHSLLNIFPLVRVLPTTFSSIGHWSIWSLCCVSSLPRV